MNPFAHLEDSLSASKIGTYLRCPLRYYFDRIERLPWEKLSGAMVIGSAMDRAVKDAILRVKKGGENVAALDFGGFFESFLELELKDPRAPIAWGSRLDEDGAKALGRSLMEALRPVLLTEERLRRLTGIDVAFTVPLLDDGGEPMIDTPLIGVFDLVEETDDGPVPLEIKTASNRTQYLPDKLQRDVQALIYGLAAKTLTGDSEARVKYISAVKLKTPDVIESENVVIDEQLAWVRGVVVGVKRAIDSGVFVARPSTIECGGCPFQKACAKSGGRALAGPRRLFD